ncbi:MAG TPA: hypothetical protein VJ803_11915 [Gemmatimonadaceae bacterium]|nr:hypothetical protein [Gemmatimonadaceae bacterium]
MTNTANSAEAERERRKNQALRNLIDEMLDRVRELNRNNSIWTPEERAEAEETLALIMERVRRQAALPGTTPTNVSE